MSLSPTRRRAEQFADLLERAGRTDDPALEPAVALAGALQSMRPVTGPRPEFRQALRQRLVAVATVQVAAPPATATERLRETAQTWRFQRRVAVIAGGAAAATAIAGVGLGASRSLPGEPFYGIKRATEDVQLATSFGQEAKGKRHLEFARTRLAEVQALAGRSDALEAFIPGTAGALGTLSEQATSSVIVQTLHDMDAETRAGAADLMNVYRQSGSGEPLRALDSFTRHQYDGLRSVLPELPTATRPHAESSLMLLTEVAAKTVRLAAGAVTRGGTRPGSGSPSAPAGGREPGPQLSSPPATRSGTPSSAPGTGQVVPGTSGGQQSGPGLPTAPATIPPPPSLPVPLPTSILPSPHASTTPLPTLPTLPTLPSLPLLGG
ncbi:MAG TPA: DUF5667 domain-containing protein [Mycobacteriales bacterium]|nr:DUF5667 domain-containing protein [Mycobacteriales bacterium]